MQCGFVPRLEIKQTIKPWCFKSDYWWKTVHNKKNKILISKENYYIELVKMNTTHENQVRHRMELTGKMNSLFVNKL